MKSKCKMKQNSSIGLCRKQAPSSQTCSCSSDTRGKTDAQKIDKTLLNTKY